jgi:hypothetical protein
MLSNPAYSIDFNVHVYDSNQIVNLTMRNFEVIRFAGLRAPPMQQFENLFQIKLYEALDENYPGFDFGYSKNAIFLFSNYDPGKTNGARNLK